MAATTNDSKLNHTESVSAKGAGRSWTIRGIRVSAMRREDAGVDCTEPWIASCDTHAEMLGCPTKRSAEAACRNRDWCSTCSQADTE